MASASSSTSSAIRRLPLREALSDLTSGEGSTSLPSKVKAVHLSFVQKNSPSGPRDFIRSIAPRIAYANPTLPININRIRDPRSKALDPKSPDAGIGKWESGIPSAELRVEIEGDETKTIDINALSSSEILRELLKASGGPVDVMAGITSPGESSMAEMLAQGADTTYADIGKEPFIGENPVGPS